MGEEKRREGMGYEISSINQFLDRIRSQIKIIGKFERNVSDYIEFAYNFKQLLETPFEIIEDCYPYLEFPFLESARIRRFFKENEIETPKDLIIKSQNESLFKGIGKKTFVELITGLANTLTQIKGFH